MHNAAISPLTEKLLTVVRIIMIEISTLKVATIMYSTTLTKVVISETISTLKVDILLIKISKRETNNNLIELSLKFKQTELRLISIRIITSTK